MTLDTLREDLAANRKLLEESAIAMKAEVPADSPVLMKLLEFVLAAFNNRDAFQEVVIDEVDEIDGAVEDLYHRSEDILQPVTAQQFMIVLAACDGMINELGPRLKRDNPKDKEIAKALVDLRARLAAMRDVIARITVVPDEEEVEEEDDDAEDEPAPANSNGGAHADAGG